MTDTINAITEKIITMSEEDRADLVERLKEKAADIGGGNFGEEDYPGQNALWAGDLYAAAGRIETIGHEEEASGYCDLDQCGIGALTNSEAEEIEAMLGE